MRIVAGLMIALALAACGADGDPVRPERDATGARGGVGVSGDAWIGVQWSSR